MEKVRVINTKTGEEKLISARTAERKSLLERNNLIIADEIQHKTKNDGKAETKTKTAMLPIKELLPKIETANSEELDVILSEETTNESGNRKTIINAIEKRKKELNGN